MLFSVFRNERHGTRCGQHGGLGRSSYLSTWFSFSCLAGRAQIRQQSDTHADCLSKCSDLIEMSFQQASIFTEVKLQTCWIVFEDYVLHLIHFLSVLCTNGHRECWRLQQRSHYFWTWKNHINTCVVCINCSPKATINILKVSVANLPSFKQNFMQAYCSFNSIIF